MQEQKNEIEPGILELAEEGYNFRATDYIKEGWNLFNRDMAPFILFGLILFGINFLGGVLNQFVPGTSIGLSIIIVPLSFGMSMVAKRVYHDEPYEFKNFFDGFDHLLPLLAVSIIGGLLTLLGLGLLIIPGIYLAIAYSFSRYFVVFRGYKFWQALEASRKLITKQFWDFLLFGFLLGLIWLVGFITCGIGSIFTTPLIAFATYCAFADVMSQTREGLENDPYTQDPFGGMHDPNDPFAPPASNDYSQDPFAAPSRQQQPEDPFGNPNPQSEADPFANDFPDTNNHDTPPPPPPAGNEDKNEDPFA